MSEAQKTARQSIDWEAVEMHYRAGIRSLKDIGKEYGVSDAGILKRAKKDGWTRDLSARIQAKAEAKVSASAVSELVSVARAANEQAVVEANAELQYRIRMEHRQDIGRSRGLFRTMLQELEASSTAEGQALIQRMHEIVHGADDADDEDPQGRKRAEKLREMLNKALSLSGRADTAKKLVETLEKLVRLEREAFGIKSDDQKDASFEEMLRGVLGG